MMKKISDVIKIICALLIIAIGMYCLIASLCADCYGEGAVKNRYGADFYTDVQNAAAQSARNLMYIGNFLSEVVHILGVTLGTFFVAIGGYLFAVALMDCKKESIVVVEKSDANVKSDSLTNYQDDNE